MVVIVFGGVVGMMVVIRDTRAAVKYEAAMADEGTVVFLASRYKTLFLSRLESLGIPAADSKIFFDRKSEEGPTYGELFEKGFREYVASIIIANHIYNSYTSYSLEDKRIVAASIAEVVEHKAGGSISEFNELTKKYGFDYNDFEAGCELLYKAETARTVVYGQNGENLRSFPEECKKYLDGYSHVSLLFIRDETKIVTDEKGVMTEVELTDEEKAERQRVATLLRNAINERVTEGDGDWITPEMFETYLPTSDGDKEMHSKGYYFRAEAEKTLEFAEEFPEVVETALSLKIGEYAEAECEIGTCFIYRYEVKDGAYSDSENLFFSDFYSDAADALYRETLDELSVLVEFRAHFDAIDALSVPKNYEFYVRSWKRT